MSQNVIDKYKGWEPVRVREDLERKAFPYSVLMQHIDGDFNISTFVRNGNAFGAEKLYYFGQRKWDRRGAVGTHNYKQLNHIASFDELVVLSQAHRFVAIENNVGCAVDINSFTPCAGDIYLFGEETQGLTQDLLSLCSVCVFIPQFGSVRSLNVGTASGIVMHSIASYFASHMKGVCAI